MKQIKHLMILIAICSCLISLQSFAQNKSQTVKSHWSLSFNKFGPVKIGMKPIEAEKVLGYALQPDREVNPDECHFVSNGEKLPGVFFMVVGGRIVRIDIQENLYETDQGARIGMNEDQIKKIYPSSTVSIHPYDETGHYISIFSAKYGMIFSTDGKVVKGFRAGQADEVKWIEGCE